MHDLQGKPLLTITKAMPIDSKHHMTTKAERLMQGNFSSSKESHFCCLNQA